MPYAPCRAANTSDTNTSFQTLHNTIREANREGQTRQMHIKLTKNSASILLHVCWNVILSDSTEAPFKLFSSFFHTYSMVQTTISSHTHTHTHARARARALFHQTAAVLS